MHNEQSAAHDTGGTSHRISATAASQEPLCDTRLWPGIRTRIFLGEYDDNELKGFIVELTPDPDPVDALTLQIIKLPSDTTGTKWKLFLQADNKSQVMIKARVRQL